MQDPIDFWLNEVLANRAASTRRAYRIYLTQFLKYLDTTAEAVVAQREQDLQSGDVREKKRYENRVKKFDQVLKERGRAPGSRKQAWGAVKSFFRAFDLDLKLTREDAPKGESEEQRAITKPEIRRLLAIADHRNAAIIYMLKDTGLRVSDLAQLRVGDVDLEAEYPMLKRRTKKRGIIAKTFLGPEAQTALKKYLAARRYGTNTIPREAITATSPLFRKTTIAVQQMTANGVTVCMRRLMSMAQLQDVSAHAFRRFYETALEAAGVSPNWIDQMIGHRLSGARGSYSKPTDTVLREAYTAAYDRLRVDEPTFDNERIQRLEEERQQEHGERQQLAEKVLRVVDDNLAMKERLQTVEAENAELRRLLQEEMAEGEINRVTVNDMANDMRRVRAKNEEQHTLLLQMGEVVRKMQLRIKSLEEINGKGTEPR